MIVSLKLLTEESKTIFNFCVLIEETFNISSRAESFAACALKPNRFVLIEIAKLGFNCANHLQIKRVKCFGFVEQHFEERIKLMKLDVSNCFGWKVRWEAII